MKFGVFFICYILKALYVKYCSLIKYFFADELRLQQMPYLASNAKNLTKNRKN